MLTNATLIVPLTWLTFKHPIMQINTFSTINDILEFTPLPVCETEKGQEFCTCGKYKLMWAPCDRIVTLEEVEDISQSAFRHVVNRINVENVTRAVTDRLNVEDENVIHNCPICVELCTCEEYYSDRFCNHVCNR